MDSTTSIPASKPAPAPSAAPRFEINIYQLAGDDLLRKNRRDGTGWEWAWADWKRDWMDETASKFAYRCLPLTIANQTGYWVYNPVGFTAVWSGRSEPGNIGFLFDSNPQTWSGWINNQFGLGVITWNTPLLWRTKPEGSRLLVSGPVNSFKHGIQPLTAIIESDWMNMSFTMNWKFTAAGQQVRFDAGEPLFQVIPMASNVCEDLEKARVTYMKLADDPETFKAYQHWHDSRKKFHEQKAAGQVKGDDWQKDYFKGRDVFGREVTSGHKTKVTPPKVNYPKGGG